MRRVGVAAEMTHDGCVCEIAETRGSLIRLRSRRQSIDSHSILE